MSYTPSPDITGYLDVALDTTGAKSARLKAAHIGGLDLPVVGGNTDLSRCDVDLNTQAIDLERMVVRI